MDGSITRFQAAHEDLCLLSPAEAQRILCVSRRTLRRKALRGELREVRLSPRCVRFRREDLERIIQEATAAE